METLTQEAVKKVLNYSADTGDFVWKSPQKNGQIKEKSKAGWVDHNYVRIGVLGKKYYAHRLAWIYHYGFDPVNIFIDHIDRNGLNNRIENLRLVSQQCNMRNSKPKCDGSVKGISWSKKEKKWIAQITVNYVNKNLGRFKDFSEAVCMRLAVEQCLNWSGCDSSSPAYQYVRNNIQERTE